MAKVYPEFGYSVTVVKVQPKFGYTPTVVNLKVYPEYEY